MANSRLSGIETRWSLIRDANASSGGQSMTLMIERYGPAIKRYLLASLRNEEAADEVFQEFALRLVRGDFRNANEHKGRFRSLIKTALYHLIVDWHRKQAKRHKLQSNADVEFVYCEDSEILDEPFSVAWREVLLQNAWSRLLQLQKATSKPYYSVLKLRVDHPEFSTTRLQELFEQEGYGEFSKTAFRVFLHRARKRFATLLVEQVRESMESPTDDELEAELIELGLHHYCKADSTAK
ncbi:MAG: sigma factor [Pirellulaceae bacterium]